MSWSRVSVERERTGETDLRHVRRCAADLRGRAFLKLNNFEVGALAHLNENKHALVRDSREEADGELG